MVPAASIPGLDGANLVAVPPSAVRIDPDGAVAGEVVGRRFEGGQTRAITIVNGQELVADAVPGVELGPTRVTFDVARVAAIDD